MAGRPAARQGDSSRGREGAPDTARRSTHDLRGRSDAVRLRRVHPPRDLAGDAARDGAEQALVPGRPPGNGKGRKSLPVLLVARPSPVAPAAHGVALGGTATRSLKGVKTTLI